jgi:hypothetical protein
LLHQPFNHLPSGCNNSDGNSCQQVESARLLKKCSWRQLAASKKLRRDGSTGPSDPRTGKKRGHDPSIAMGKNTCVAATSKQMTAGSRLGGAAALCPPQLHGQRPTQQKNLGTRAYGGGVCVSRRHGQPARFGWLRSGVGAAEGPPWHGRRTPLLVVLWSGFWKKRGQNCGCIAEAAAQSGRAASDKGLGRGASADKKWKCLIVRGQSGAGMGEGRWRRRKGTA